MRTDMTKLTVAFSDFEKASKQKVKSFADFTFTWDSFEQKSYYLCGKASSFHGQDVRGATFTQSVINCIGFILR